MRWTQLTNISKMMKRCWSFILGLIPLSSNGINFDPYPSSVYIYNSTVYYDCNNNTLPSKEKRKLLRHQLIPSVSCHDSDLNVLLDHCDVELPGEEVFLFEHYPNGLSNYFHAWVNDFLPLLRLIMGPNSEFSLADSDWKMEKVNKTFVEKLKRPYTVLTGFTKQATYWSENSHINILLGILHENPIRLEQNTIYCFSSSGTVWPGHFATALSTKIWTGLVWQTQLYVRQELLGLQERCCDESTKPILLWVERSPNTDRYLYSWKEILNQLAEDFDVHRLDAGKLEPRDLLHIMDQAEILLGVHGAGLQNMVWMRPFRSIVEIRWPRGKKTDRNYQLLSAHLRHFYSEVDCYHLNATEFSKGQMPFADQYRIVQAVKSAWDHQRRHLHPSEMHSWTEEL